MPILNGIRYLEETEQTWVPTNNGKSLQYDKPVLTGQQLDANQGDNPSYQGTCGLVSCENVLRMAGRTNTSEKEVLDYAITQELCTVDSAPGDNGGTYSWQRERILRHFGLESFRQISNLDLIAKYVAEGRGVIITVDAVILWELKKSTQEPHAVTVTSVQTDLDGNVEGFYICDSGSGKNDFARFYTAEKLQAALMSAPINVTTSIIR